MRSRSLVFVAGLLALTVATVACGSSNDSTSSGTTGAPGTTAVTGTTGASGGKKTSSLSPDEIKKIQTQLNKVGCDAGPVDGIDGGETEAAVKSFQKASGLTVDGLVGPQTLSTLDAASAAGKQVCTATPPTTGGATTTTAGASTTNTTGGPTTTAGGGGCPGPQCTTFTISPNSGAAGTVINVSSVSGLCTTLGQVGLNPTNPPGPSIATGALNAEGMNQYKGTVTVPAGTKPGSYVVQAWSTAAMQTAGTCQASFTVT